MFTGPFRGAVTRRLPRAFEDDAIRHIWVAKVEVVARILGHAGVGVTCDIYRHVATEEIHREHGRFAPLNGHTG